MNVKQNIAILLFLTIAFFQLHSATITDPVWRESIGGNPLTMLQTAPEAVFIAADNKALQAFHRSGKLLWRTYFKYKLTSFFSVSDYPFLYTIDVKQTIYALNRNGTVLWSAELPEMPLFPPEIGRDGRLYICFAKSICCYSFSGHRRWQLELSTQLSTPLRQLADGNLVVISGSTVQIVSPFGTVIAQSTDGTFSGQLQIIGVSSDVADKRSGVRCIIADKSTVYGCTVSGSTIEATWRVPAKDTVCASLADTVSKTAAYVTKNGTFVILDSASGTVCASLQLPIFSPPESAPGKSVWIKNYSNKWYTGSPAGISAVSNDGSQLWNFATAKNRTTPVLSDEGDIYTAGSDWILYAYRAESRIQDSAPLLAKKAMNWNIGNTVSKSHGTWFCADEQEISAFLNQVDQCIAVGLDGSTEPEYTRRLGEIAADSANDPYGSHPTMTQRTTACVLLGKIGSDDSRVMLCQILETTDSTMIQRAAVIALGMIQSDFNGETVTAIKKMIIRTPVRTDESLLYAVCDTLQILCRTMGSPIAEQGIRTLSILSSRPFPVPVQKKATVTLENLLNKK